MLVIWSVILTGGTLVLGAAPLKAVRLQIGAAPFWCLGMGLSLIFWALQIPTLAIALVLFTILIGTWVELEKKGFSLFHSASGGTLSAAAVTALTTYFIARPNPALLQTKLTTTIQGLIERLSKVDVSIATSLKAEELLMQLPSFIIILFMVSAALVAIAEKPIQRWMGQVAIKKERLTDFKLPDASIWLLIGSVFFAFWDGSSQATAVIATNTLNILVVAFFFQGLAILCRYFQVFRVGSVWRVLWITLFTMQLFLVLSFIGVLDFWLDFRNKIFKKVAEVKKKKSISE